MTLDTRVYVLDRIDYREVFLKCNQLIGAHEGIESRDEPEKIWREGKPYPDPSGRWSIWNKPGQGLCALLDVSYRKDGPYVARGEHARFCEPDEDESHQTCFPRWLEVSFDTAYSYHDEHGGCGALHARLVFALGQWLDERGVRWRWENEFTGEIHEGYADLSGLVDGGAQAADWFRTAVAPVIASQQDTETSPPPAS